MTEKEIEKINGYYRLTLKKDRIDIEVKGTNKKLSKGIHEFFLFRFGISPLEIKKEKEKEKYLLNGDILEFKGEEILKDYFKIDKNIKYEV